MEGKLRGDGQLLGAHADQFTYIYSRLEDTPQSMSAAFYESGGPSGLYDPSAFLRYLTSTYEDPNVAQHALDNLDSMNPPAEILCTYGASHLKHLIESVNEGWNNSIPLTSTRPQPDYCVGFKRDAFSEDQLAKLSPFIGDFTAGDQSFFMATYYMYFRFLTCEVKCGAAALDIADRQNAHSMALAVRGIVELFRAVKREDEVNRKILAFSVSHDHQSVRIYGHYPVITGKDTKYYRHPIRNFVFTVGDRKLSSSTCTGGLKARFQALVSPQLLLAEDNGEYDPQELLKQLARLHDDPNKVRDAEDKLQSLKQEDDPLAIFLAKFERLLYKAKANTWPENTKIALLRRSLNKPARGRLDTQIIVPEDYGGFVALLQKLSGRQTHTNSGIISGNRTSNNGGARTTDPMEIGAISSINVIAPVPGREYLTDAEVEAIFGRKR